MNQYMLILHDVPNAFADVSPAEMQAIIARYVEWSARLEAEGRLRGGHKLKDHGGHTLRREGDRVVVAEGPLAEAREVIGGYFLIAAEDDAEAVAIARGCPHLDHGRIELRAVEDTTG